MKRSSALLTVAVSLLLGAVAALLASRLETDTSAEVFLAPDDPVRSEFDRLGRSFGSDPFVVVTCRSDGARLPGDRVDALARTLEKQPGVRFVESAAPGSPLARGLGITGANSRRKSLLVFLASSSPESIDAVRGAAAAFPGLDARVAGQPILNQELRAASDAVSRRLLPLLALAMALLIAVSYRSAAVTAAILLTTGASVLLGMAILALFGEPVNLITILLPVLLLALTVALCLHLVHAYRRYRRGGADAATAAAAMRRAEFRPCLVTTITTAAGFGSFGLSRIEPLRVLGVTMAISILAALLLANTLLPALLVLWRPRPREGLRIGARLVAIVPPLVRHPLPVAIGFVLLVAAGASAAARIPRETNGLHYLPTHNPLRVETERLAREGVGAASLEIVLDAAPGAPMTSLRGPIERIGSELGRLPAPVRGVVTPLTLAREAAFRLKMPDATPFESLLFSDGAGPMEARLARFRNASERSVRITVAMDPIGVDAFRGVRERIETIARDAAALAPGSTARVTGEFELVMTVQRELLSTLIVSLAGTAATILVVLAIAARSVRIALATMLPALAPLAFVLLICAVASVPLSIATVMVLAVTLGIVTDDSVHLVHVIRQGHRIEDCLRRVGTPVTETSMAILAGFAVLGLSPFLPTRHFGLLTAGATVVALAADLLLFPVLFRRHSDSAAKTRGWIHETASA